MVVGLGRLLMSQDLVLLWTPGTGTGFEAEAVVQALIRVVCLHAIRRTAEALEAERQVAEALDALRAPQEVLDALRATRDSLAALRSHTVGFTAHIKLEC